MKSNKLLENRWMPAALIVAGIILLLSGSSSAHSASYYYPDRWQGGDETVFFHRNHTAGINVSDFRNAVNYARGKWNNVSGAWFDMWSGGDTTISPKASACAQPSWNIFVYGTYIDGKNGSLGNAQLCVQKVNDRIIKARIRMDGSESWYTGSSWSVPSNRFDLRAALTHEFGHATGWSTTRHFSHTGSLCSYRPGSATMCKTLLKGEPYWRTLSRHDMHTFADAY